MCRSKRRGDQERTIELTTTIDAHQFEIVTGYRGDGTRAKMEPPAKPRTAAAASLLASTGSRGQPGPNPFAMARMSLPRVGTSVSELPMTQDVLTDLLHLSSPAIAITFTTHRGPAVITVTSRVRRRPRLGGLLNLYERAA